jgi:hypothetical protein
VSKHGTPAALYGKLWRVHLAGILIESPEQIGNMKKRVSVYSGLTGAMVADFSHPSYVAGPHRVPLYKL